MFDFENLEGMSVEPPEFFGFGKIDNSYGFVENTDPRYDENTFIKVTPEEHQQLFEEQSEGKQIVCYEGKVFTAEPDRYYLDDNGEYLKRTDEELAKLKANQRKTQFLNTFFKIGDYGYYRKIPKGYSTAMDSLNCAMNALNAEITEFPAGTFIFYKEPDFTQPEQCTEDWLIANQIKSDVMSADEFKKLYTTAVIAWNTTEH